MSCRKALLELHRRGAIKLPEVSKSYDFNRRKASEPPPVAVAECALADLGEIKLVRVGGGGTLSGLWRGMMDAHHYLRSGPLCGDQLRYLIHGEHHGWLGGLSYSACAHRVECREEWIGWNDETRRLNQILVVNNSRFLIAPTVRVTNLASHVLARCQARLVDDWESAYGYRPVLLETYVERGRFHGGCYRAANWRYAGRTNGRGRQGTGASVKDVFLMPLDKQWQSKLCRCPDGTVRVNVATQREPRDWIENELGNANMGDARLTARLLQMTGMFYEKPTANIPQACGSIKAAKAAYRFLDNPAVEWTEILASHYEATEERLREHRVVLAASDSTSLNHGTHPHTQGLGPIGSGEGKCARGLMLHETMAYTPDGTALGLLDVQCWARTQLGTRHQCHEKPIEEKESMKWVRALEALNTLQPRLRKTTLVMVADREADIYELFARQASASRPAQLLIRAERSRNRKTSEEDDDHNVELLWPLVERRPVVAQHKFLVPPTDKHAARQATLELRAMPATLRAPKRVADLPDVKVWAVMAREVTAPTGVEPLEWLLVTTVKTESQSEAERLLEWYARRWGIEVFHRILKSGCGAEARQLENASRLFNCLAIDLVVAWRIQYLASLGRETPDVPCTVYFTDSEWKALTTFTSGTKTPPPVPPSLNNAVALLGILGGHMGRKGDGPPGTEVLWRAMSRLADIEASYTLYH